MAFFPDH